MYEQRTLVSPLINCIWRAVAEHDGSYSDPANEYWSLGFARDVGGSVSVNLFGPSLVPRVVESYKGEVYWGIEFHTNVIVKGVNKGDILDTDVPLVAKNDQLLVAGRWHAIPQYDELISFATQLEKDGIIANDQRVFRALNGDESGFSERSRQRHFRTTTGLNKKQIEQIQRARHAYYLLQSGYTASEVAHLAGYADQSHMTRSLKLLRGETPARIITAYLRHSD